MGAKPGRIVYQSYHGINVKLTPARLKLWIALYDRFCANNHAGLSDIELARLLKINPPTVVVYVRLLREDLFGEPWHITYAPYRLVRR